MSNETEVAALKERVHNHGREIGEIKAVLDDIESKLEKFGQRPSWATTSVISFLMTLTGILITLILKR